MTILTFPPNPEDDLTTCPDHELPIAAALAVTIKPRDHGPVRGFCYIHAERALCFHRSQSSGKFLLVDRGDGGFDLIEQA
jgi:hypothetical protein